MGKKQNIVSSSEALADDTKIKTGSVKLSSGGRIKVSSSAKVEYYTYNKGKTLAY